jgi:hypothetical protein
MGTYFLGVIWPILLTITAPILYYLDVSKSGPKSAMVGAILLFVFLALISFFFVRNNIVTEKSLKKNE